MLRAFHRVMLVLALLAGVARAQGADDVAKARQHFEAGRALYNLGNFRDAIREFSAGYQLAPRPQFLVNLGQAYRKLGELEKARDQYRKFLDEAPPNDPDREQVQQILGELEQQIAAQPPPAPAPAPAPTVTPVPSQAALTASAPPRRSWAKRNWWVFPVGAVVVGAALGVGLYFGLQPHQIGCGEASLGCIDAMGK